MTSPLTRAKRVDVTRWLAILALIVAIVDAVFIAKQTGMLRDANALSRNDQRAWVGPVDISASQMKAGSRLRVSIPLSNSGRTPAKKVKVEFGSRVDLRGQEFKGEYHPSTEGGPESVPVIQPSARQYLNGVCADPLTEEEVNGIGSGDLVLLIYGRLTYEDVFRQGHETTFAYRWVPALSVWRALDTYNDAD